VGFCVGRLDVVERLWKASLDSTWGALGHSNYCVLALLCIQSVTADACWLGACDLGLAVARPRILHLNTGDPRHSGFGMTLGVGHLVIEIIRIPAENERHWRSEDNSPPLSDDLGPIQTLSYSRQLLCSTVARSPSS
jgi:hypothetical protein